MAGARLPGRPRKAHGGNGTMRVQREEGAGARWSENRKGPLMTSLLREGEGISSLKKWNVFSRI